MEPKLDPACKIALRPTLTGHMQVPSKLKQKRISRGIIIYVKLGENQIAVLPSLLEL